MEIRVREDSVNPAADRAKFRYRRFLDADSEKLQFYTGRYTYTRNDNKHCDELDKRGAKEIPAGEVFVAVKETRRPIQRVSSVINRGALLGSFVRRAQEYPLFRRRHLRASFGMALVLQSNCQAVELHAELPEMLVLPYALVVGLRHVEYQVDIRRISSDHLLNVLLHGQSAVHLFERLVRPPAEIL